MSEQVLLPNGEEADVVLSNSIALRGIASDPNMDLKGGEAPQMYFDKFSRIQPVYIVGALSGVLPSSSSSTVVNRTTQSDVKVINLASGKNYGTALAVPSGATGIIAGFVCTAFTAGGPGNNLTLQWEGSDDGVNFGTSDALDQTQIACTAVGDGATTWPAATAGTTSSTSPARRALPPYVRACIVSNSALNNLTGRLWVSVN